MYTNQEWCPTQGQPPLSPLLWGRQATAWWLVNHRKKYMIDVYYLHNKFLLGPFKKRLHLTLVHSSTNLTVVIERWVTSLPAILSREKYSLLGWMDGRDILWVLWVRNTHCWRERWCFYQLCLTWWPGSAGRSGNRWRSWRAWAWRARSPFDPKAKAVLQRCWKIQSRQRSF